MGSHRTTAPAAVVPSSGWQGHAPSPSGPRPAGPARPRLLAGAAVTMIAMALGTSAASCGSAATGDDGGACGDDLTGVELCVQAQEYIECGPCEDAALNYAIDTEACEDDGTRLCANCIANRRAQDHCILDGDCAAECAAARQ